MAVKSSVGFPIAAKMIVLSVGLLLSAVIPIAFKCAEEFENRSSVRESDANQDQANAKASAVENIIFGYIDRIRVISAVIIKSHSDFGNAQPNSNEFVLGSDIDIVGLEIFKPQEKEGRIVTQYISADFEKEQKLGAKEFFETSESVILRQAVNEGKIQLLNTSFPKGPALLTIAVPLIHDEDEPSIITHAAIAVVKLDRLQAVFSKPGVRDTFLVDSEGRVLAHTKDTWVLEKHSLSYLEIVRRSLESKINDVQLKYYDSQSKEWFVGAFSKTSFGLNVISQASDRIIKEPAFLLKREAYRIAGWVLSAGVFLVFLFSSTMTKPIERLLEITEEIRKGNFEVKNDVRSLDEVGALAAAIRRMVGGLKERDLAKEALRKFHGSHAEIMMKGNHSLGGTRKQVAVFFSDLRDFTKFSEGHTPEDVLSMLNEYFQVMVGVVNRNHGFIDKFVGDAMMAVWGVPESDPHDCYWAVKSAIEMRQELAKLNQIRIQRKQPPIKMGMGIHFGEVISGNMGSSERMEYTVIGDTVNQASRIESCTKAFGTDLLVSEEVANIVKEKFILSNVGDAQVKGKSEFLTLYKVRGYIGDKGEPIPVMTPYSDYEASHSEKVNVA